MLSWCVVSARLDKLETGYTPLRTDNRYGEVYPLEPGLLLVFRVYTFLRFGAMVLVASVFLGGLGVPFELKFIPTATLFILEMGVLIVYLYSPWVRRRLGSAYLPLALVIATVGPILEMRSVFSVAPIDYLGEFWLIFPFLAVPLIINAWQYSLREVMLFCLATAALDLSLVLLFQPGRANFDTVLSGGSILTRTLFFLVIGYIVSTLMEAQRRQRQELAEAHRSLVRYTATLEHLATVRERNRLARELHDTLAHTLSGLAVEMDALSLVWQPESPKARDILEHALSTTRSGLDETRRAMQALRASPLDDLGFVPALRSLAEGAAQRGALTLDFDAPNHLPELSPEVEQIVYRVAQEALENVIRHAQAHHVSLTLALEPAAHGEGEPRIRRRATLRLTIGDDGLGCQLPTSSAGGEPTGWEGLGIRGMQERAALIGGTVRVQSRPGAGTVVTLRAEVP
jgi:signal transduction histidine kinase